MESHEASAAIDAGKPIDVKQLVVGMVDLIGRTTGLAIRLELVNGMDCSPA